MSSVKRTADGSLGATSRSGDRRSSQKLPPRFVRTKASWNNARRPSELEMGLQKSFSPTCPPSARERAEEPRGTRAGRCQASDGCSRHPFADRKATTVLVRNKARLLPPAAPIPARTPELAAPRRAQRRRTEARVWALARSMLRAELRKNAPGRCGEHAETKRLGLAGRLPAPGMGGRSRGDSLRREWGDGAPHSARRRNARHTGCRCPGCTKRRWMFSASIR